MLLFSHFTQYEYEKDPTFFMRGNEFSGPTEDTTLRIEFD